MGPMSSGDGRDPGTRARGPGPVDPDPGTRAWGPGPIPCKVPYLCLRLTQGSTQGL